MSSSSRTVLSSSATAACVGTARRSTTPGSTQNEVQRERTLRIAVTALLLLQAELGKSAVAVPVGDEPRHLAVADVEHARPLRSHLIEVESAGFGAPEVPV